jgi:hypothetical protein
MSRKYKPTEPTFENFLSLDEENRAKVEEKAKANRVENIQQFQQWLRQKRVERASRSINERYIRTRRLDAIRTATSVRTTDAPLLYVEPPTYAGDCGYRYASSEGWAGVGSCSPYWKWKTECSVLRRVERESLALPSLQSEVSNYATCSTLNLHLHGKRCGWRGPSGAHS